MDVWGAIFKAQWAGAAARHQLERDDGRVETLETAANHFIAPRTEAERELLSKLEGPLLDLAAGAGSYAMYLQANGLRVTAADFSPGALAFTRVYVKSARDWRLLANHQSMGRWHASDEQPLANCDRAPRVISYGRSNGNALGLPLTHLHHTSERVSPDGRVRRAGASHVTGELGAEDGRGRPVAGPAAVSGNPSVKAHPDSNLPAQFGLNVCRHSWRASP